MCQAWYLFNLLFFLALFPSKILVGQKIDVHPLHFMTTAKNKKPHSIQEMGFQFLFPAHVPFPLGVKGNYCGNNCWT